MNSEGGNRLVHMSGDSLGKGPDGHLGDHERRYLPAPPLLVRDRPIPGEPLGFLVLNGGYLFAYRLLERIWPEVRLSGRLLALVCPHVQRDLTYSGHIGRRSVLQAEHA